eukprot:m.99986 g.99986  ORF g.99986 m.99986 type:complete len:53 (-) comp16770_c0_seq1:743-901(-)
MEHRSSVCAPQTMHANESSGDAAIGYVDWATLLATHFGAVAVSSSSAPALPP